MSTTQTTERCDARGRPRKELAGTSVVRAACSRDFLNRVKARAYARNLPVQDYVRQTLEADLQASGAEIES